MDVKDYCLICLIEKWSPLLFFYILLFYFYIMFVLIESLYNIILLFN